MLPDLIEIVPPGQRRQSTVVLPGSKSITNRALILAALAKGTVVLRGALWSEDTQAMMDCLERLGFRVGVEDDPSEAGNRTLTVRGAGPLPRRPLWLTVAGFVAMFLTWEASALVAPSMVLAALVQRAQLRAWRDERQKRDGIAASGASHGEGATRSPFRSTLHFTLL